MAIGVILAIAFSLGLIYTVFNHRRRRAANRGRGVARGRGVVSSRGRGGTRVHADEGNGNWECLGRCIIGLLCFPCLCVLNILTCGLFNAFDSIKI